MRGDAQFLFQLVGWTEATSGKKTVVLCAELLGLADEPPASGQSGRGAGFRLGRGVAARPSAAGCRPQPCGGIMRSDLAAQHWIFQQTASWVVLTVSKPRIYSATQ